MKTGLRLVALCAPLALLAACGGKKEDAASPLAYVPADTAWVLANTAPVPKAISEARLRMFQPMWKPYFEMLGKLVEKGAAKATSEGDKRAVAYVRAILDEIQTRDSLDKWRELGFDAEARMALYSIGLAPVARIELADPAAFRAMIGRIEAKVGDKIPVAKIGDQDYWRLGTDATPLSGAMALEGKQLVLTVLPKNATDPTVRALLGLDKPGKTLLDAGTLAQLNKERGYLEYGSGYVDVGRVLSLVLDQHQGTDAEFAKALEADQTPTDPTCRSEIQGIAAKFPRVAFGTTKLDATNQNVRFEFDIATALREQLVATATPVPGMAAADDAMLDFVMSVPVLKGKDFLAKQAEAVAAAPFQCAKLSKLNENFAQMKTSLAQTVPPPFSDFLGFRFTIDKLGLDAAGQPDPQQSAGRVLLASSNPLLVTSMAQMTVPQLKDVRITADGKAVAIPTTGLPIPPLPIYAAASNNALVIAAGNGADVSAPAMLTAPAGDGKTFLRARVNGAFYQFYGQMMERILPKGGDADVQAMLEMQKQMYNVYATMFRFTEVRMGWSANGMFIEQDMQLAPAK